MGTVIVAISLAGKLLGFLPIATDAAIRLRKLLQPSGVFSVDIVRFYDSATAANAETERLIAEWEAANPPA